MHVATSGRTLGTVHTIVRFRKLYVSIVSIFEPQNRLLIWVGVMVLPTDLNRTV